MRWLYAMLVFIPISLALHFGHVSPGTPDTAANPRVENLGLWVSGILIALYLGGLWFSLHSHQDMFRGGEEEEWEPPQWKKSTAYLVLAGATALVAWESELL